MDKSETFIKMCDCPEIQEDHEYTDGNYVAYIRGRNGWAWAFNGTPQVELYYGGHYFDDNKIEFCWLPRQDDLQKMVEEVIGKTHFVFRFNEFVESSYLPITHQLAYTYFANLDDDKRDTVVSMEQLWLAFVMKEKYNKVWTNNEWRNGSES